MPDELATNPATPIMTTPVAPVPVATPVPVAAPASAPVVAPAAPVAATHAPVPVTTQQTVTIPLEQIQAFTSMQARLAQIEADQRARDEAAQRDLQNALLAKGQAEEAVRLSREQHDLALKQEREQKAELQRQAQGFALDVSVARAMAGHSFVNDKARRSFEQEVRAELIAEPHGSTFNVRTSTFQTADDLVKSKLESPDYQFLLAPKGIVGTATPGQPNQAAPAAPAPTPQPEVRSKNMGHAYILQYKADQSNLGEPLDPRHDPSQPYGLTSRGLG